MALIDHFGSGIRKLLPQRQDRGARSSGYTTGDGLLTMLGSALSDGLRSLPGVGAGATTTLLQDTRAMHVDPNRTTQHADSSVAWQWRGEQQVPIAQITALRYQISSILQDCQPESRDKVMLRICSAHAPIDLWLLRIDVFGIIAQSHGQSEARKRINSLLPHFQDLLPPRLLMPI